MNAFKDDDDDDDRYYDNLDTIMIIIDTSIMTDWSLVSFFLHCLEHQEQLSFDDKDQ